MRRGKDKLYSIQIGFWLLWLIDFIEGAGTVSTQIIFYQGHPAAIFVLTIQQIRYYFHPGLSPVIFLYTHRALTCQWLKNHIKLCHSFADIFTVLEHSSIRLLLLLYLQQLAGGFIQAYDRMLRVIRSLIHT